EVVSIFDQAWKKIGNRNGNGNGNGHHGSSPMKVVVLGAYFEKYKTGAIFTLIDKDRFRGIFIKEDFWIARNYEGLLDKLLEKSKIVGVIISFRNGKKIFKNQSSGSLQKSFSTVFVTKKTIVREPYVHSVTSRAPPKENKNTLSHQKISSPLNSLHFSTVRQFIISAFKFIVRTTIVGILFLILSSVVILKVLEEPYAPIDHLEQIFVAKERDYERLIEVVAKFEKYLKETPYTLESKEIYEEIQLKFVRLEGSLKIHYTKAKDLYEANFEKRDQVRIKQLRELFSRLVKLTKALRVIFENAYAQEQQSLILAGNISQEDASRSASSPIEEGGGYHLKEGWIVIEDFDLYGIDKFDGSMRFYFTNPLIINDLSQIESIFHRNIHSEADVIDIHGSFNNILEILNQLLSKQYLYVRVNFGKNNKYILKPTSEDVELINSKKEVMRDDILQLLLFEMTYGGENEILPITIYFAKMDEIMRSSGLDGNINTSSPLNMAQITTLPLESLTVVLIVGVVAAAIWIYVKAKKWFASKKSLEQSVVGSKPRTPEEALGMRLPAIEELHEGPREQYFIFNEGVNQEGIYGLLKYIAVDEVRRKFLEKWREDNNKQLMALSFGALRRLHLDAIPEAYRIVIAFLEHKRTFHDAWEGFEFNKNTFKIIALDQDRERLEKAHHGIFHEETFMTLGENRDVTSETRDILARYFDKIEGATFYQAKKEIRELIEIRYSPLLEFNKSGEEKFDLILHTFTESKLEEQRKGVDLPIPNAIISTSIPKWLKDYGVLITTREKFQPPIILKTLFGGKSSFKQTDEKKVTVYVEQYQPVDYNEWVESTWVEVKDYLRSLKSSLNEGVLDFAFNVANDVHKGQKREMGGPYIIHPLLIVYRGLLGLGQKDEELLEVIRVHEHMTFHSEIPLEAFTVTAILHDVIEDYSGRRRDIIQRLLKGLADKSNEIMAKNILNALLFLTKNKGESDEVYLQRLLDSGNELAMFIKIFDRLDNFRLPRASKPESKIRQDIVLTDRFVQQAKVPAFVKEIYMNVMRRNYTKGLDLLREDLERANAQRQFEQKYLEPQPLVKAAYKLVEQSLKRKLGILTNLEQQTLRNVVRYINPWLVNGSDLAGVAALLNFDVLKPQRQELIEELALQFHDRQNEIRSIAVKLQALDEILSMAYLDSEVTELGTSKTVDSLIKTLAQLSGGDIDILLAAFAAKLKYLESLVVKDKEESRYLARFITHIFVPVAAIIGLHNEVTDINNITFKVTNPSEYEQTKRKIEEFLQVNDYDDVRWLLNDAYKFISEQTRSNQTTIRTNNKSIAAVYEKVKSPFKTKYNEVRDIMDLLRIMIITDDPDEVLGQLSQYKNVDEEIEYKRRIKDGHDAIHLHIILEASDGGSRSWEVQIITPRDYKLYRFGFAEGFVSLSEEEKNPQWWWYKLKRILKNDNVKMMQTLKNYELELDDHPKENLRKLYESFKDQIYVSFIKKEKKGKTLSVIELDKDAMAIDLAFHPYIHLDQNYNGFVLSERNVISVPETIIRTRKDRWILLDKTQLQTGLILEEVLQMGTELLSRKEPMYYAGLINQTQQMRTKLQLKRWITKHDSIK
ncbi:MAG: hypothetical protein KC733_12070, partial [Candidatus Omnitrophica bacterium]|nr:hypothetical protein [Candidatus Omnitrophota bacterium]